MQTVEYLHRSGILTAHLILPNWKGDFPYDWPKHKWPIIPAPLFIKQNQITRNGQTRSYTYGLNFKYIAAGTGQSGTLVTDTILGNELQRFSVDEQVKVAGQIDTYATIPSGTGNQAWKEWGMFMDDATTTLNSGTMYSRILQNYTKNLGDNVLITYTVKESLL